MKIDAALIEYLENLSRLSLGEDEREQLCADLEGIIGYMNILGQADVGNTPALSHPFAAVNCFREDEVAPSFARASILAGAPDATQEYFKAPKIVE